MSRRMIVSLAALMGLIGVLLVPAVGDAAPMAPVVHPVVLPAPSVTAQIGFPPVFDLGQLLRSILASLPPFLQNVFRPIFDFFISQFCVFFNNCASP